MPGVRNPGQAVPDHSAILATLGRSIALAPTSAVPGGVPPGSVVRLAGVAQPGPAGVLQAPMSGRPCVWFRAFEMPFRPFSMFSWRGTSGSGPRPMLASDCGFGSGGHHDSESGALFTVELPGGAVLVDPTYGDVDAAVVTVDTADGSGGGPIRREWIIEPGTPVFVLGTANDYSPSTLVVHATPADCLVVSTRGEAAAVQRSRTVAGSR